MNFAVRRLIAGQELKSGHPRFTVIVPAQPAVYKASNVKKKPKIKIGRPQDFWRPRWLKNHTKICKETDLPMSRKLKRELLPAAYSHTTMA